LGRLTSLYFRYGDEINRIKIILLLIKDNKTKGLNSTTHLIFGMMNNQYPNPNELNVEQMLQVAEEYFNLTSPLCE